MGFLDSIAKVIGRLSGGGEKQDKLIYAATDIIADRESGGLDGLAARFKDQGLGEIVSSWIGTDRNQPVSAEQIQSAVGSEKIRQVSESLGFSSEEVSSGLAAVLPWIVDLLTPDGQVPGQENLEQEISTLKEKLPGGSTGRQS